MARVLSLVGGDADRQSVALDLLFRIACMINTKDTCISIRCSLLNITLHPFVYCRLETLQLAASTVPTTQPEQPQADPNVAIQ